MSLWQLERCFDQTFGTGLAEFGFDKATSLAPTMNWPHERRSTAGPMDFEYTSEERNASPAWLTSHDPLEPPRKRTHYEMTSSERPPAFPTPQPAKSLPFVQTPSNTPFLFHTPASMTPPPAGFWEAPQDFSPGKAFPPVVETTDISMDSITSSSDMTGRTKGDTITSEGSRMLLPARRVSTNAVKRVNKSRHRARNRLTRQAIEEDEDESEESDSEEEEKVYSRGGSITANHHYTFNMPNVPANRSEVPYMLLGYVQFFFNLSLVLVFLYLIINFIINVQRDVEHRMEEYRTGLREQVATCARMYDINRCSPISERVPALAQQCTEWESCMQRDPGAIGRARVTAETIGEVFNSFVEPITWKTLIFSVASLAFLVVFINVLFSFYRARIAPEPYHHPPVPPPMQHYPTTPVHSRVAASPFGVGYSPVPPIDWGRTWSGSEIPISASPSKKRKAAIRIKNE